LKGWQKRNRKTLEGDIVFCEMQLDAALGIMSRIKRLIAEAEMRADAKRITHLETRAKMH